MKLNDEQETRLNSIPLCGRFSFDQNEETHEIEGERIKYLYVDYGLMKKDKDNNFWGNWNRLTSGACDDRAVDSYVNRNDMRDYEYVMHCSHHKETDDGIYKFSIAVGGI